MILYHQRVHLFFDLKSIKQMKIKNSLIAFLVLITSCVNTNKPNESKPEITVSILPQEYFVRQIAGDYFKINIMIPQGASPATYEPTPAQLAALSKSKLYLRIGYTGFELAWMDKLSAINTHMKIYNLADNIDLIMENSSQGMHSEGNRSTSDNEQEHHHGGIDPHVWLSPKNVRIIAGNIYDALETNYPEQEKEFRENYTAFLTRIDSLDNYIKEQLSGLSSYSFFTYHPSLSYFARDYGLNQYPLELGGKTPSAGYMKMLVDSGKKNNIGVVFLQMQFDQKNAEVLANEIGAEIVQMNPLDPEWFEQMKFITRKLKENLQ